MPKKTVVRESLQIKMKIDELKNSMVVESLNNIYDRHQRKYFPTDTTNLTKSTIDPEGNFRTLGSITSSFGTFLK